MSYCKLYDIKLHHASILQLIAMKSTVTNYANDQEGTVLGNSTPIHKTMGQQRKFIKH